MAKLSVIIPSRNEKFLPQTVEDIFTNAVGEIEVIVALDGYWPDPPLKERPNLILLHTDKAKGMRYGNNAAAAVATGEYLMKCDAHCLFAHGFDEVLKADCEEDWLVVPRRKRLDAANWRVEDMNRLPIDHHYLDCPMTNPGGFQFHGVIDGRRTSARLAIEIDDTMSFQGSCWFMTRKHWDHLGGKMSEEGYGAFCQEPQELGNKTWLGPWDGRVVVNKKTLYGHLHKGKQWGRIYSQRGLGLETGHIWSAFYWMNNCWPERVRDIEWLIEKFWPIPNWPENWKELLETWRASDAAKKFVQTLSS